MPLLKIQVTLDFRFIALIHSLTHSLTCGSVFMMSADVLYTCSLCWLVFVTWRRRSPVLQCLCYCRLMKREGQNIIKGTESPKMNILLSFLHPRVDIVSQSLESCTSIMVYYTMKVN